MIGFFGEKHARLGEVVIVRKNLVAIIIIDVEFLGTRRCFRQIAALRGGDEPTFQDKAHRLAMAVIRVLQ